MSTTDLLVITARLDADPACFARFTWNEALTECDFVAGGLEDDQVDALVAAKGHEGAAVAGYTITVD